MNLNDLKLPQPQLCTFRWLPSFDSYEGWDVKNCKLLAGHVEPHRDGTTWIAVGEENRVEHTWGL